MIEAEQFLSACKAEGFDFFTGTPCSYLKPLINAAIDDPSINYYIATNEGDAVAMGCGAYLGAQKSVVMFQNSGLGNAVNALTSLAYPFKIPVLLIITHRGKPGGVPDEPQHELMGEITLKMLELMKIKWEYFPSKSEQLLPLMKKIEEHFVKTSLPFALIMDNDVVEPNELKREKNKAIGKRNIVFSENFSPSTNKRVSRREALNTLLKCKNRNTLIITTTGKTGRELYELEDAPEHFYMVGSMGSAPALSLGLALTCPNRRVITVDGDGALLMRMGNVASVGAFKPKNFIHLLLDNDVHDSTGGQETISTSIPFSLIAQVCGYEKVYSLDGLKELEDILLKCSTLDGPIFIHFKIKKGCPKNLGRPKIKPHEVTKRFINYLKESVATA